ncbi:TetR/AcrR family transcriptional regulator [Halobacteria archaeon AArc-m2/3/4]|uniref:TetR/AcrR family transcriptional regulator n=1 Tax=Natronoglomus mannanivorans TaxID=2979990 RepID=A0AAP2YX81_9EURY|nr:TetR/AcrR family transcriptional regulator [Halobacteria archaeon AArc-xg1-1]MCU4972395.1 TetR/AcrR family transcriptional regulator [Halobacteria archaeon AArc-m2/3/4]
MRGFSDDERDRLREDLIETGRDHLLQYGPEKTTVTDVTEPVGIAKGTFYRFFDSKAELYIEIVRREQRAYFDRVESDLAETETAREGLEVLFHSYLEWIEENDLIQRTIVEGDYGATFRGVSTEKMEELQQAGLAEFVPIVDGLRERDEALSAFDSITVLGLLSTVALLALYREEFELYEEGYYERIKDVYVSALAAGLTSGEVS